MADAGHLVLSDVELPGRLLDSLDLPYTCTKSKPNRSHQLAQYWPVLKWVCLSFVLVVWTAVPLNMTKACALILRDMMCSAAYLRQVDLWLSWSHRDKGAVSLKISGVALTCATRQLPIVGPSNVLHGPLKALSSSSGSTCFVASCTKIGSLHVEIS